MAGAEQTSAIEIDPRGLDEWLRADTPPQLVDVREPYERQAGHIPGSRHIELTELAAAADSLARDVPVVFFCRTGARSLMAAQAFRASGLEAYSLRDGLLGWVQEGHALAPAGGHVADH